MNLNAQRNANKQLDHLDQTPFLNVHVHHAASLLLPLVFLYLHLEASLSWLKEKNFSDECVASQACTKQLWSANYVTTTSTAILSTVASHILHWITHTYICSMLDSFPVLCTCPGSSQIFSVAWEKCDEATLHIKWADALIHASWRSCQDPSLHYSYAQHRVCLQMSGTL